MPTPKRAKINQMALIFFFRSHMHRKHRPSEAKARQQIVQHGLDVTFTVSPAWFV